jgi:hypothetical protein
MMTTLLHILAAAAFAGIPAGLMIWSGICSERY